MRRETRCALPQHSIPVNAKLMNWLPSRCLRSSASRTAPALPAAQRCRMSYLWCWSAPHASTARLAPQCWRRCRIMCAVPWRQRGRDFERDAGGGASVQRLPLLAHQGAATCERSAAFRIDAWDDSGNEIVEHISGVEEISMWPTWRMR
jgi:hypothetical protein